MFSSSLVLFAFVGALYNGPDAPSAVRSDAFVYEFPSLVFAHVMAIPPIEIAIGVVLVSVYT